MKFKLQRIVLEVTYKDKEKSQSVSDSERKKQPWEVSPVNVLIREKLEMPKMEKSAIRSHNRFSLLPDEVIDRAVDKKEELLMKIKVPPVTFTELQRETIKALFIEFKIENQETARDLRLKIYLITRYYITHRPKMLNFLLINDPKAMKAELNIACLDVKKINGDDMAVMHIFVE